MTVTNEQSYVEGRHARAAQNRSRNQGRGVGRGQSRGRGGAGHPGAIWAARLTILVVLALIWWIGSRFSHLIASPAEAVRVLVQGFTQGWIVGPFVNTLEAIFVGFLIALAVGVPFGIMLGVSETLGRFFNPFLSALFAVPRIVLYPVILAAVGVGLQSKIWMAILSALLPIIMNTTAGARNTEKVLLKLGASVGCGRLGMILRIRVPAGLPAIMVGIRIGLSVSVIAVVIAELFAATTGLGLLIQSSYGLQQYSKMYAVVLLVTLLAFCTNLIVWTVEKRIGGSN